MVKSTRGKESSTLSLLFAMDSVNMLSSKIQVPYKKTKNARTIYPSLIFMD
jgi:hypothetical protein